MIKIISTTRVQQQIGMISASVDESPFIVTKHGEARIVMLPYFDGCDENIEEYLEDYEMRKNKNELIKRYKKSSRSGKSKLVI